ncbi:argininosuccinate lyase [Candidatus Roizmanbacteria bacterium CG22_combo_CG10-13_8_21_14_all_35_9]|uniref:Argininosuccinate lyase n=1 Tax=Candidatus Roizmanbacteria bacterium CG22_combo_CG10-13_8_21_14_all_35_9 TaxID=1974861 RepID=A0A2H0BXF1_9BACT|nr:MAG: argininosuccinate lyase [Candidatus Roizmanbacteria bacterium CG22_combo_CG10-13_8_21_14_all_35_9]PJC84146.1 MAG: argininosuccinate lyase [Candidatus Roizmanbacteria bacterium CG_4_8_14_3_um_filter_35_14]
MKDQKNLETASYIVSQTQIFLDLKMVSYDLWATTAHILMLNKQNIINNKNTAKILKALKEIEKDVQGGKFNIDPKKGAQLTLEAKIIEKIGDVGYSVHTGRSRNDQIMVIEMLYLKNEIIGLMKSFIPILAELFKLAKNNIKTVMPGYTHMQPAKPTTFGQWALAYLNGFLKSLKTLEYYFDLYDSNPLGSCESYGTSWPLDREFTTKLLGFSKAWEIPQDAVSSRGFVQLGYLNGMAEVCLVVSKLAQDLILFDTFEYGMIALGDEVAQRLHPITGSSVMAQKKNPDVLELIRSTAPQVAGYVNIVFNILDSLPMGYNRDSREVKEYIDLGLTKTKAMIKVLEKVLTTLKIDKEKMLSQVENNYSLTTDLADFISQKSGVGYRLIYKIVGQVVDEAINKGKLLKEISADEIINKALMNKVKLQLTNEEIKKAIDPKLVIEKRNHIGGSSVSSMKKSLKNAQNAIKDINQSIKKKLLVFTKAKEKTDLIVNNLLEKYGS